ncbi:hypothetical protein P8452_34953 [Trifolium repens]|nr:hypothetical protein P8452_34953 [Trifolium repens]
MNSNEAAPGSRVDTNYPVATFFYAVVGVVVFIVTMAINNCPMNNLGFQGDCLAKFLGRLSFQPFEENPLFGPSSYTLTRMGALGHQHQAWRLFTSMWLHAGVLHLLTNTVGILFLGIHFEKQFGIMRIGLIFLLSGFGGSVLSSLFIRNSVSVGSSGVLFGLIGAMLSEVITNWTLHSNKVMTLLPLLVISVANLVVGIFPHADNIAHIGGLLVGILLGFILLPRPRYGELELRHIRAGVRQKAKYKAYQLLLGIVSLTLLIVGLSIALVTLFRGGNVYDNCNWCHYLTCVPSSKWDCSYKD